MGVGHEHDGLFGIIDMYGEGLAFFKGGDAYPYASGFSDAAEAMGFRIAWNREQDKSLQIESVICEKHGVGMTKDGDLILSAFRARLVDVGGRFGKGHSNIYGLDDCRIHGGLLPKILGSFTIGENSKIGAGSVVLEEVPPNCTVVGVPGRIVRMNDKKVPRTDMDQIHLPDPVLDDIRKLQQENIRLHGELRRLVKEIRCVERKGDYDEDL